MNSGVPEEIRAQIAPMPADFAPSFEETDRHIKWEATVPNPHSGLLLHLEYGYPRTSPYGREQLTADVWEILELVRLSGAEHVRFARRDRHQRA